MPELFSYLLKVNAALVLFCLAYYLVLRKLTFYNLNRIFLLVGIVFSTLYPLVNLSLLFKEPERLVIPLSTVLPVIMATEATAIDYWWFVKVVFWIGVLLMTIQMAIRLFSLYKIHQQSTPTQIGKYPVRLLKGDLNTFSFWKHIYLNPGQHEPKAIAAILEHEQVHVKELHTLDILLAELATIFYWFNPGVWYMRKAVKENVEFITDQQLLKKGVDRKAYQYSMLHVVTNLTPSVLMNNFNLTGIKRRIMMMNSKASSPMQLSRYILVLPVLLLLSTAFTFIRSSSPIALIELQDTLVKPVKKTVRTKSPQKVQKTPGGKKLILTQKVVLKEQKTEPAALPAKNESGASISVIRIVTGSNMAETLKADSLINEGSAVVIKVRRNKSIPPNDSKQQPFAAAKIFIDDQESTAEQMKTMDPESIARIDVRKDAVNPANSSIYIYTHQIKNLRSPLKVPFFPGSEKLPN